MATDDFACALRREMIRREVTQAQLSKACGLSQGTLSKMLNGRQKPSGQTLVNIAAYFGMPAEQLLKPTINAKEAA